MEGTLLRIGLHNEKFKTAINKNAKIITCNLLEEPHKNFGKKKFKVNESTKTINIKKLRNIIIWVIGGFVLYVQKNIKKYIFQIE